MEDYQAMYYNLFNQLTDVIEQLKEIQAKAEEMYINANSDDEKEQAVNTQKTDSDEPVFLCEYFNYLFIASSTATATATVIPTIGLLPAPISPIIST